MQLNAGRNRTKLGTNHIDLFVHFYACAFKFLCNPTIYSLFSTVLLKKYYLGLIRKKFIIFKDNAIDEFVSDLKAKNGTKQFKLKKKSII